MKNKKSSRSLENNLRMEFDRMSEIISDLLANEEYDKTEMKYLNGFLHYMNLEEEYHYFRRNAVEVYEEDIPFPYLTLK